MGSHSHSIGGVIRPAGRYSHVPGIFEVDPKLHFRLLKNATTTSPDTLIIQYIYHSYCSTM